MGILLALGAGKLWSRDSPLPCPLERVDLIAAGGALLVDNQARRCAWRGRCFTCAPGIEDALCWGQRPAAALRGGGLPDPACPGRHAGMDASYGRGTPAALLAARGPLPGGGGGAFRGDPAGAPAGAYAPAQLPGAGGGAVPGGAAGVAVCGLRRGGGGDPLPAVPPVPAHGQAGNPAGLSGPAREPLAAGPGGALYLGATERLYRFTGDPPQLGALREGFGLPRRILPLGGQVLVADPVLEQALVLDAMLQKKPMTLYRGEVQDACITSSVPGNPSP